MSTRTKHDAKKTLLCATRFWSIDHSMTGKWQETNKGTTPSFRHAIRHVVRKQGFSSSEIEKAEQQLVKDGLLIRGGGGSARPYARPTLALTPKAASVSCARVKLAPWTDAAYTGSTLTGARRKPRRGLAGADTRGERYTYHGVNVIPRWDTKRRVAGGYAIDVVVDDPRSTLKHSTVNVDGLVKHPGLAGARRKR